MTFLYKYKILLYLFVLSLGFLSSFSLPPYNLFYLNFFSYPALLWVLLLNSKNKIISFNLGWTFGFGFFISNLYWLTNSLTFEDTFKTLIPFALILIPLFLGLFYGISTLVFSFSNPKKNILSILILATTLSLFEYLRSFMFGGFPWNLISFSFVNYLEFIQLLSITGTYAFNSIIILIFLMPTILFFNLKKNIKLSIFFLSIILFSVNHFWGKSNLRQYELNDKRDLGFTVKIISPKINIKRFFQNEDPIEFISELIYISEPNLSDKTIFILPEGILSSLYFEDLKKYKNLFSNSFSKNHKIILGMNIYENEKIYNSLLVLNNELKVLDKYYKNNLVPFGEFLPFEKILQNLGFKKITQGYQSFSPDNRRDPIKLNDYNFLPLICYEVIFSGKINKSKRKYDFILNISEDGWFGNSIGPHQHFSKSIFRAIESDSFVLRSANKGLSAIINNKGQIIKSLKNNETGSLEYRLPIIENNNGNKNDLIFFILLFTYCLIFLRYKNND